MRIFLTGATGFLGGTLASRLVHAGHEVRGLNRNLSANDELVAAGVSPVFGTLDDLSTLNREARTADAVINAADSDHSTAVDELLRALEGSGKPFLHTSGSSIVGEPSNGEFEDRVFTEEDVSIKSTWIPAPEKQARVAIDRSVIAAADRGVKAVVLCNTMIYGTGEGVRKDSVQIPRLVSTARASRIARHIGPGENVWSNVALSDVCDLYLRALEAPRPGAFYFVENGEENFRSITTAIATTLRVDGPTSISIDEAIAEWGREPAIYALGSNSRVRGVAAREELGWTPREKSVIKWISDNVAP